MAASATSPQLPQPTHDWSMAATGSGFSGSPLGLVLTLAVARSGGRGGSAWLVGTLAPAVLSLLLPAFKPFFVICELFTVGWAAQIYLRSRDRDPVELHKLPDGWRKRYRALSLDTHQRWLDARLIAESQRSGFHGLCRSRDCAASRTLSHTVKGRKMLVFW